MGVDALVTAIRFAVEAAGGGCMERTATTPVTADGLKEYEGGESIPGLLQLFEVAHEHHPLQAV